MAPASSWSMSRPWRSDTLADSVSSITLSRSAASDCDGRRQRPAAERAEANQARDGRLARAQRHAVVVEHQQAAVALDGRPLGGEVERHHVEPLAGDVAPHVLLGPVGEREDARRLAGAEPPVEQAPHLGSLLARVPAVALGAEGEHALLGARGLLVAPRAAERRIEAVLIERLPQRLRLHDVGVGGGRVVDRVDAGGDPLLVGVHDQVEAELAHGAIAEGDHVAELPGGIDVQQRERRLGRIERLARQVQQHRGVLADGIEQHRLAELRGSLAEDVDALRLQQIEMASEARSCHGLRAPAPRAVVQPALLAVLLLPPPAAGADVLAGRRSRACRAGSRWRGSRARAAD